MAPHPFPRFEISKWHMSINMSIKGYLINTDKKLSCLEFETATLQYEYSSTNSKWQTKANVDSKCPTFWRCVQLTIVHNRTYNKLKVCAHIHTLTNIIRMRNVYSMVIRERISMHPYPHSLC